MAAVGIAAGGGDQPGPGQFFAVELGEPVHEPPEQVRGGVGLAVPGRIQGGVPESEVGGQIDDDPHLGLQLGDQVLGLPVREGHEHQVQAVELRRLGGCVGQVRVGGGQ